MLVLGALCPGALPAPPCPQVSRQHLPALLSFPRLENDKCEKHSLIKHAMRWLIKWLLGVKREPC